MNVVFSRSEVTPGLWLKLNLEITNKFSWSLSLTRRSQRVRLIRARGHWSIAVSEGEELVTLSLRLAETVEPMCNGSTFRAPDPYISLTCFSCYNMIKAIPVKY